MSLKLTRLTSWTTQGTFFYQQCQQQVSNCAELEQLSDGIDRNGRLVQALEKGLDSRLE
jgi:hypothetical protein